MERLLQPPSSSPLAPSKSQFRASPLLLRVHRLDSPTPSFPSSRRVSSISCLFRQNPSPISSPGSNQAKNLSFESPSWSPEADGSKPNPGFLEQIVKWNFQQRKPNLRDKRETLWCLVRGKKFPVITDELVTFNIKGRWDFEQDS